MSAINLADVSFIIVTNFFLLDRNSNKTFTQQAKKPTEYRNFWVLSVIRAKPKSLQNHGFGVNGQQRKSQGLIYSIPGCLMSELEWLKAELNCRPWAYESPALTTELLSQKLAVIIMP
jgi:hypothetical protein